jgi:hypothetical protein
VPHRTQDQRKLLHSRWLRCETASAWHLVSRRRLPRVCPRHVLRRVEISRLSLDVSIPCVQKRQDIRQSSLRCLFSLQCQFSLQYLFLHQHEWSIHGRLVARSFGWYHMSLCKILEYPYRISTNPDMFSPTQRSHDSANHDGCFSFPIHCTSSVSRSSSYCFRHL